LVVAAGQEGAPEAVAAAADTAAAVCARITAHMPDKLRPA
jgi:hypothetical protein